MSLFSTGALLSLSLCLDLGIVNIAAMRAGVQAGALASLALGIGSCLGDLVYATAAVAGVTRLLEFPAVRWILWIGGTGALAYLAAKALRDGWSSLSRPDAGGVDAATRRATRYFRQGLALALASPSAILWFASVGGAVIATTTSQATSALWPFFAGFFITGVLWSIVVAVVSASGRRFGATFIRAFSVVSAVVFAGLAINVFINGYRTFISR